MRRITAGFAYLLAALALGAAAPATNAPLAPAQPATAPAPAAAAAPAPPPVAKPPPAPPTLAETVAAGQAALARLGSQAVIVSNDARLAAMEARAAAIEAQGRAAMAGPAARIAAIDAQIARIVPRRQRQPTAAQKAKEAPLLAERAALAAQVAQAEALVGAAGDTYDQIAERRREGFSARVLTRSVSPLDPEFWTSLAGSASADGARLMSAVADTAATALAAPEPRGAIGVVLGLLAALALLLPVRVWAERLGRRKRGERAHPGFSKTGAALWVAVVDTGAPTLAVVALRLGAQWGRVLSPQAEAMASAAVVASIWAAGILALGRVLATERDASHRLLPLPDEEARRVRLPLLIVALVTGIGFMLTRLNYVIGASVAATIAANCAVSLAYAAAALLTLVSFGRGGQAPVAATPAAPAAAAADRARAPVWTLISLILAGAVAVTLAAVFAGYTTLAALTSGQIFWLGLIAAAAYLVMRFVDDLTSSTFGPKGWASRSLFVLFRLRRTTVGQVGALISAAAQVIVVIGALSLASTPFGRGGDLLFSHLSQLGAPIRFGSAVISPGAIATGLVTFLVGMGLVRVVQGWIVRRYLPVTDWDLGVRNSVLTGVGYLGVAIAILCGLAATGLGFGQIALIASALSVGIGFGLQQIVQNFVSGVILLVERPVKVGDWVSIDNFEGDIRRIRVRATEIETFDRSMVIVPNSDLITKPVQNKTLGKHASRVQLKLSITRADEVGKARDLILGIATAKKEVLGDPAPAVFIDSLGAAGAVNLTCNLYVGDPRLAYRVRSECYFEVLDGLAHYSIGFAGVV
ncbi:MAG TPA: DUF3772 domain-containing protein [Caulobacteraceae bacterium]|jgi:small-conductance mechanosensitive channel